MCATDKLVRRSLSTVTDMAVCTLCGIADTDMPGPSAWLAVEVSGTEDDGTMWWINEYFCSQAHAAEWMQTPITRPEPSPPYVMTLQDRVLGIGLAGGAGALLGLAGLGALTAGRFLIDRL